MRRLATAAKLAGCSMYKISSFFLNRKHRAITAIIVAAFVVSIMLLSVFFVATEQHHDCTGDDCPVCAVLQMCEASLQQTGDGGVSFIVMALLLLAAISFVSYAGVEVVPITPVSAKVRMNH